MSAEWTVRVADDSGAEVGQIAPVRLEAQLRYSDVGTWLLDVDFSDRLLNDLLEPGASIVVYPPGSSEPLFAGPWVESRLVEGEELTVEVAGVTDEVLLARRVASPDPAFDPPWTQVRRQLVGPAHEVLEQAVEENAGQSAPVAARRSLTVDPQVLSTSPVRWTATGQPLLELLQGVSEAADVGFRVDRVAGVPTFRTFLSEDRSATVIFSAALGTVEQTALTVRAPEVTAAIVAGAEDGYGGQSTVLVSDAGLEGLWGRIELLVSHGQSDDVEELEDVGLSALEEQKPLTTVDAVPVEGAGNIVFPESWRLGDRVTIRVGGTSIVETVRQVTLVLESGQAPRVRASLDEVGSPAGKLLRRLGRRLALVEAVR